MDVCSIRHGGSSISDDLSQLHRYIRHHENESKTNEGKFFFNCGHATLQEALSVRPSVGRLVGWSVGPWTRVEKCENAHFCPSPPVRDWY